MIDPVKTDTWQRDESENAPSDIMPPRLGRYRLEKILGHGGFGVVYLAHDDQLERQVAIKVPHRTRVAHPEDIRIYVAEARVLANLDHPNIVPVHDVGCTEDGLPFIISKYIEGDTLAKKIKESRLAVTEVAEVIATVAEALHYAHRKGLVHRDIKPGNILLDAHGKPFVTDFGLALKEEDFGKGASFAGTPAYMSPEQARCEGHRVEGRSDIFSLGVVLYESLTGRRPFHADTRDELLEQITSVEPRPPRQIDDAIPRELERICLKALCKRASERYTTAKDFADDLRHFFQHSTEQGELVPRARIAAGGTATPTPDATPVSSAVPSSTSHQRPIKIVPKGLRSFDANDADFFLELLPGPRDRDGLPDSIRFWKTRIDEADPDKTFSVGLIYGPSGCGKSSLVKAGLVPRLAANVLAVYVEATARETEIRLLKGLRKSCPDLRGNVGLVETVTSLRRRRFLPGSKKVLIILDQFEQWLHARREEENAELVQALRQCDGARVQCVVMVRDDFWLGVSRFMGELEVKLLQDHNIGLVDLFDKRHARKVLAAFGRAFGAAAEGEEVFSKEQKAFLEHAVAGLAQEGKIIPVRLALFAEMIKGKPWVPATLKEIGGMEGVGVAFLEETFAAATAQPQHRLHRRGAQAVLKALLPATGTDIKGNMKSYAELLEVSGYANRVKDFDDLIHILDSELRLITPTETEEQDEASSSSLHGSAVRYYQLTHDYLVHALQDWLTRKQQETWRGRAELRLAERSALWNARPEKRRLPSAGEWARIHLLTRSRDWTQSQRKMMRSADGHYAVRGVLAACLFLAGLAAWEYQGWLKPHALRARLLSAAVAEVPAILEDMAPHRRRVEPLLREAYAREDDPHKKLLLSLALLRWDPSQVKVLYDQLLRSPPQDFAVIRQALAPYKDDFTEQLWMELADRGLDSERRFRAACALIEYAGHDPRWMECAAFVVDGLVAQNPLVLSYWKDALEPVRGRLLPALAASLEDSKWGAGERRAITEFYRVFAGADPHAFTPLEERLSTVAGPGPGDVDQAKRKANVAAALIALGGGERVWRLLVHTSSPTLRSYLIERLGSSGVDPKILKDRLAAEQETSARRALILALGGFPADQLPDLGPVLVGLYETDPDPGVHAAAGWVLRTWKQGDQLGKIDAKLATGRVEGGRAWYLNKQQQTFTILEGPGRLLHGSEREPKAPPHRFALAATEVTVKQFRAFRSGHAVDPKVATTLDSPVSKMSWYDAAEYCNWLSRQDDIPETQWCYRRNKEGLLDFVPGYQKLMGYRLPTEEEWEFACRAGAQTVWCFGEADEELVGKYAWWMGNAHVNGVRRRFPVGLLKPNDWGLFDMHGNMAELCQESARPQTRSFFEDVETGVRGGFYVSSYRDVACDRWTVIGRKIPQAGIGFRLARTFPDALSMK